jgi:hypothetical protein
MRNSKICATIFITSAVWFSANLANAEGCALQDVELKCNAKAASPAAIMEAFASQETRTNLAEPLSQKDRFSKNGDLEKYRQSIERNWRIVTRFARTQQRDRSRNRITEAQFLTFSNQFQEAEKSYAAAINFYRQLHWQGLK